MRANLLRLAPIFLAVALLYPALGPATHRAIACEGVHPKTGDLNADGMTNSLDALSVLEYDAGMMKPASDTWFGGADVNCDTTVNSVDATIILQVDAGLTTIRP